MELNAIKILRKTEFYLQLMNSKTRTVGEFELFPLKKKMVHIIQE